MKQTWIKRRRKTVEKHQNYPLIIFHKHGRQISCCSSNTSAWSCFCIWSFSLSESALSNRVSVTSWTLYNITSQSHLLFFLTLSSSWRRNIYIRVHMSHLTGSSIMCVGLIHKQHTSMSFIEMCNCGRRRREKIPPRKPTVSKVVASPPEQCDGDVLCTGCFVS